MDLHRYLNGLYGLITSRQEIDVERLFADETVPRREGVMEGRLRFWDGSLLEFVETLVVQGPNRRETIVTAAPPHLHDVLREIDLYL